MKLFKNLTCDNYTEINNQIKEYVNSTNIVEESTKFWNLLPTIEFVKATPLFREWLNSQGLKLHSIALTVGRDAGCCKIHTDTPPAVNKLSWPIQHTQHTFNRWFRSKIENPTIKINNLGGCSYLDISQLEEIGRMEVTTPCIINARIPHDVWFDYPGVFPRIGLQGMLMKEPIL
jgi:hypothetical protein